MNIFVENKLSIFHWTSCEFCKVHSCKNLIVHKSLKRTKCESDPIPRVLYHRRHSDFVRVVEHKTPPFCFCFKFFLMLFKHRCIIAMFFNDLPMTFEEMGYQNTLWTQGKRWLRHFLSPFLWSHSWQIPCTFLMVIVTLCVRYPKNYSFTLVNPSNHHSTFHLTVSGWEVKLLSFNFVSR